MMPTPLLSFKIRITKSQHSGSHSSKISYYLCLLKPNLTKTIITFIRFDSIRFQTDVHAAVDEIQGNHATEASRDWCRLSPQVGGEKFMVQLYLFSFLSRLMPIMILKEDVIAREPQRQRWFISRAEQWRGVPLHESWSRYLDSRLPLWGGIF